MSHLRQPAPSGNFPLLTSLRRAAAEQAAPREAFLRSGRAPCLDIGAQLLALALQILDLAFQIFVLFSRRSQFRFPILPHGVRRSVSRLIRFSLLSGFLPSVETGYWVDAVQFRWLYLPTA